MKQIGPAYSIDMSGYIFPWRRDCEQPVLLEMGGEFWVPIFETLEQLRETMTVCGIERDIYRLKKIDDADDFLLSIAEGPPVNVCLNLRKEPSGKMRFSKVVLPKTAETRQ